MHDTNCSELLSKPAARTSTPAPQIRCNETARRAAFARHVLLSAVCIGLSACGGSSSGSGSNVAPRILAITASSGFAVGGTTVQIQGGNFQDTTEVTFDGMAGTGVTRLDASMLLVTTPAHPPGAVDVVVSNNGNTNTLSGGFTYVTYPPIAALADSQLDSGAVTPALVSRPGVCCSGESRFVVWAEERAPGTNNRDVFLRRSTDRGATWLATETQINTNAQGTTDSFDPIICCDGANIYVAWVDDRRGPTEPFFNRSTDGGATWLPADIRLNAPLTAGFNMGPGSLSMCCEGSNVMVAWSDERSNPTAAWDVWATRSTDAGATFLAAQVRVNTNGPGALPNPAPTPRICCEGSNVYLVWDDRRAGAAVTDVRFSRSTDGGATWLGTDVRLDMNATNRNAYSPSVCCDQSNVYVAWVDDRAAAMPGVGADVYARASTDGGVSFGASDTRVSTYAPGTQFLVGARVNICCDGANFYLTWSDFRNGGADVWFNRSADAGASYLATDVRLDVGTLAGAAANGQPAICCDPGGTVVVAWDDARTGMNSIFTNTSADRGATWAPAGTRMDRDVPNPGASLLGARQGVCCEGAFFTTAWSDDRNNVGAGFDTYTSSNIAQ